MREHPEHPGLLTAHRQACCRVTGVEGFKFFKAWETPPVTVMSIVGFRLRAFLGWTLLPMLQMRNFPREATLRGYRVMGLPLEPPVLICTRKL